jgi:NADH-quinone oxidoreductase subunit G
LAVFPPGDAREDWTIIRALSDVLGHKLAQDTLAQVRDRLASVSAVFDEDTPVIAAKLAAFGTAGAVDGAAFESPIKNYYMTDPISRASRTMAECTEVYVNGKQRTGTNG